MESSWSEKENKEDEHMPCATPPPRVCSLLTCFNPFPRLPHFSGTYSVGCHDIEWSPGNISFPDLQGSGRSPTTSVLVRLYYPTDTDVKEASNHSKPTWLPQPHPSRYAHGYTHFMKLPELVGSVFHGLLSSTHIHAVYSAPLASLKDKSGNQNERFPVMVFSHGIGGNRTTYSTICGEIASRGFVVAAVEHRDGSASFSMSNNFTEAYEYTQPPEGNAAKSMDLRHSQLSQRVAEVNFSYDLLKGLDKGGIKSIADPPKGIEPLDLTQFVGRLLVGEPSQAVVGGHSFGGATAIETLRDAATPFRAGVILDPWAEPLMNDPKRPVARPNIVISSENFTNWKGNYSLLYEYIQQSRALKDVPPSYYFTLKGSGHQSQSDFPALFTGFSSRILMNPNPIDSSLALEINANASVEFLRQTLEIDHLKINPDENILSDNDAQRPQQLLKEK